MREIFLGELSRLKLFDILKTLLVERKTGMLTIKGKETGEIYLELGNIIHSKTPRFSGEEAFLTVTAWRVGKATFIPEMYSKERSITIPAEQLLLKWSHRKQEWDKIRELIPSPHVVFRLSLQRNSQERSIRPDEWNILALTNGIRTVSEVAEIIGWNEFKTLRMIYQLARGGLLEKAEEPRQPKRKKVGDNFFPTLENEFKKVMGPVAPLIIEDKLTDFGEAKEIFPQDQAEYFIEALSEEIPNDLKRRRFIKVMGEFLSTGRQG
jgi:hypothetical protein